VMALAIAPEHRQPVKRDGSELCAERRQRTPTRPDVSGSVLRLQEPAQASNQNSAQRMPSATQSKDRLRTTSKPPPPNWVQGRGRGRGFRDKGYRVVRFVGFPHHAGIHAIGHNHGPAVRLGGHRVRSAAFRSLHFASLLTAFRFDRLRRIPNQNQRRLMTGRAGLSM